MSLSKADLVSKIAADAGITKDQAGKALNSFLEAVEDALKAGDKLTLVGFGTFYVAERRARTGVNPATGEKIQIAASKAPKFKAGKALKEAVK
ncbi:TPA: DNA-binding protein HU [Candidatus Marinimicrobia bacterium]|nr:MAG: DNA-binding protein HU 1 [Marinimicrobia bacterium 46_47]KUK91250.1 MAG: DNA-binding protein HU 1 [Marinimicrobia bacterium 46_43]HAE87209.1 DNA-binding protein HU [Candidatus Neomarinimicrobiota bacterium]HBY18921.1 DNA-binding protein HU [Candidatus Neomarinimicrobiota bacterium]